MRTFDPGFGAQQWRLFRAETFDAVFQAVNGTFFGVKVVLISNWSPNAEIIDGILHNIKMWDDVSVWPFIEI